MRTGRARIIQYGIGILLTVIFFLSGFTRGFAEETSLQINVPVHVEFSRQGLSPEKTYHLTLTPEDADAPMPEGASNGTYSLRISKADGTDYAIVIQYPKVGEYWYEVRIADSSDKALGTWELHVMSIVDENGKRQVTTTLRNGDKTGEKTDSIRVSDPDQPETVPQTPETKPTTPQTPETKPQENVPKIPETIPQTPEATQEETSSEKPDQQDVRVRGITQDTNPNSDLTGGESAQTATGGQGNVLTGDGARTEFWLTMLGISGAVLMFLMTLLHRRYRKQS
jgi:hypothetical protein